LSTLIKRPPIFEYHQNEAFSAGFKRFFALGGNYLTIETHKRSGLLNRPDQPCCRQALPAQWG
jgi:hypothetical protein